MSTYDVDVYREGRWWMIEIPAIDGLTQARRLADVGPMAASFISVDQDIPLSQAWVTIRSIKVSEYDVESTMAEVRSLRAEAERALEHASELMRKTAWRLTQESVPARDIGHVLGVSHQRVSQLVNSQ